MGFFDQLNETLGQVRQGAETWKAIQDTAKKKKLVPNDGGYPSSEISFAGASPDPGSSPLLANDGGGFGVRGVPQWALVAAGVAAIFWMVK